MNSNKHLYRYLTEKIKKSGKLQFSEFMNETLYNLDLGYYTNKENIFGDKKASFYVIKARKDSFFTQ